MAGSAVQYKVPVWALLMQRSQVYKTIPPLSSVSLIRSTRPCLNISISCPAVSPNEPLTFREKSGQTAWSLIRHPSVLSAIFPSICQFFSTSFHLSILFYFFPSVSQFFYFFFHLSILFYSTVLSFFYMSVNSSLLSIFHLSVNSSICQFFSTLFDAFVISSLLSSFQPFL